VVTFFIKIVLKIGYNKKSAVHCVEVQHYIKVTNEDNSTSHFIYIFILMNMIRALSVLILFFSFTLLFQEQIPL
jgi:hypothetical protein